VAHRVNFDPCHRRGHDRLPASHAGWQQGEDIMEISRILWPTDFSENAAKALPLVTELTQKFGAEIHILYVMKDYPAFGASYGQFDPDELKKMQEWEKQTAESRLSEICEQFLNECPLYIRHIAIGEPAKEILKIIASQKIDMVVMTNKGSEGHFDFGSVAERVLKCTTVPVVMVPA
jgi:nucleotide-binding universal stress UspA family protein